MGLSKTPLRTARRCILKMDHHCPWMNTCIGAGNYRYFLLTLVWMEAGASYAVRVPSALGKPRAPQQPAMPCLSEAPLARYTPFQHAHCAFGSAVWILH